MHFALFSRVLNALPSQCLVCHAWPGQTICEACMSRFAQPLHRCHSCAFPLPTGVHLCGACVKEPPAINHCLSAVPYGYPWSDLIVRYKFQSQPGLARTFALMLRSTPWVEPALDAADTVLPMPLSRERLRSRGFNQAYVLAQALSKSKADPALLLRIKDTPPQSGLTRAERLSSVKDAFAVEPLRTSEIKGARVVLVDDVMTSGASLFAAALALQTAGAAHITAMVVARTA
jgi:ComF family protein